MLILGLNAYHGDAAACIVRDGVLVAAAEEERFRRVKHWAGFPTEALRYCLTEAKADLGDVAHVAINSDPKAHAGKKIAYTVLRRPDPRFILDRLRNQAKRQSVEAELAAALPDAPLKAKIHRVEHHIAHLASCFFVSPFREATVASIDGFGDFSSAAWGVGRDTAITIEDQIFFPHSLGVFYQAMTQFLGFPYYGDEYKVMGLAPYGAPTFVRQMRDIVRLKNDGRFVLDTTFFRHHREKIAYEWEGGSPHVGTLYSSALEDLLGAPRQPDEPLSDRHRDLARSVQAMYEEAFFHLIDALYARHKIDSLTLAGGCAMNSVANGKVLRQSKFKRLYVQSAAGDAGGAIGAAFHVWHRLGGHSANREGASSVLNGDALHDRYVMDHAYLGPAASDDEIARIFAERVAEFAAANCHVDHVSDEAELCRMAANAVANGDVVGWFQGRMEWGPRALGNRSIICDPRRTDMKDILNRKIKRRESFRPFAPSVLKEYVSAWFEEDGDVPFMMQVYQIREAVRPRVPAVTHVDGSGRLQTVYRETNPRYWRLIDEFRQISGVPMVLNTSFNENEPVVCQPAEALGCFLRTNMDALVVGDWIVRRKPPPASNGSSEMSSSP
jgi:carbamoyltransferase